MLATCYLRIFTFLVGVIVPIVGVCLPSDNEKPMQIAADSAEMNRETGAAAYQNNVEIDQGTTHIRGDKLTTHNNSHNKLEKAVVEGSAKELAHYRTLTELNKPELKADAMKITFYTIKRYVILEGQAQITQGKDLIQGERLEYDLTKRQLKAPEQPKSHGRTTIIIEPDSIADSRASSASK